MTTAQTDAVDLLRPILWATSLESLPELYMPGLYAYDWDNGIELEPVAPWSYENKIENFLRRDPGLSGSEDPDNILIVIGGIGTGKSTSISRAVRKVSRTERTCSKCSSGFCSTSQKVIPLDFKRKGSVTDPLNPDAEVEDDSSEEFWTYVHQIVISSYPPIPIAEEISDFWSWCLQNASFLELSPIVSQTIFAIREKVDFLSGGDSDYFGWSRKDIQRDLIQTRENFLSEIGPEDLAWYAVYRMAFQRRQQESACKCAILFLDNVDHLSPELQRIAVDLAVRLSQLIPARTILAVRPLTWERSFHGHYLINSIPHRSPNIHDVLWGRIDFFLANTDTSTAQNISQKLRFLAQAFSGRGYDPLLKKLIEAASGLSIRYALRNFNNMLESRLVTRDDGDELGRRTHLSTLAKAFLFGSRKGLIPQSFDNIYSVKGMKDEARWLVKPRILEILYSKRTGGEKVRHVHGIMRKFGCETDLFVDALNEMLVRKRPLIWCNVDSRVSDPDSVGRLTLTPIGHGYIGHLFGEVLYDENTIPWEYTAVKGPAGAWEFHKLITARDLLESRTAKEKYGALFYFGIFSQERPSLSFRHAENLMRGLPFRIGRDSEYDPKRIEWVRSKFLEQLGPVPKAAGRY